MSGDLISQKLTVYATKNGEYTTSVPLPKMIPSDLVPGEFTIKVTDPKTTSSITITVN